MSDTVAWIPPEVKVEVLGDRVANTNPYVGEYRRVRQDGEFGSLMVWVDDAPDDATDGEGHFAEYGGSLESYEPTRKG